MLQLLLPTLHRLNICCWREKEIEGSRRRRKERGDNSTGLFSVWFEALPLFPFSFSPAGICRQQLNCNTNCGSMVEF